MLRQAQHDIHYVTLLVPTYSGSLPKGDSKINPASCFGKLSMTYNSQV